MGYFTTLLRLRNISSSNSLLTIRKAKKYLKPGQKPPEGVKTQRGSRGGIYYNTEDVHAARGTTPQKRLPAFRKQEDNSLRHRTKAGEHGPGSYFIREKEGQNHLSFVSPEGHEQQLGSHADIRELKKQVAKFKGKEVSTDELLKRPHYSLTNSNGETTTVIGEYKDQEPEKKVSKKKVTSKKTASEKPIPETTGEEKKESSLLSSGDKRHDPDQRKIVSGLGKTEAKPLTRSQEPAKEFGTDSRQSFKLQEEKRSRQDSLNQNRLNFSETKKKSEFSHLRNRFMNHDQVRSLPAEHKDEIIRALDDAESIYIKSPDKFKESLYAHRKIQSKAEGLAGPDSGDASLYLKTLNTIDQAPDDWYHPEQKKPAPKPRARQGKSTSHSLVEQRIKLDMINTGLDPELHDIRSLIDNTLSYRENRANVAKQLGYSYTTKDKKEAKERADHHQCINAQERCEIHNDKTACKEYNSMGCHKKYGALEA